MSEQGAMINLDILLGHVEIQKRYVWSADGRSYEGQGRSLHYDRKGMLIKTTPWETSVRIFVPESEPRAWWRFWCAQAK